MSKKELICLMAVLSVSTMCIFLFPKLMWLFIIAIILLVVEYILNRYVLRNLQLQKTPFQINSNVRNVDFLIIGDMIDSSMVIPQGKSFVQIKAPNRTLYGAFEILKHTSSILDEDNGNVVIAIKNVKPKNYFLIFDIPFFYNLTIKKYDIEKFAKLSRVPFLVKPLSSIKLLLNICNKKWEAKSCPDTDVVGFCDERSIHLMYYEYKR